MQPRVSAIVVVHNVGANASSQAPLDLCLRSALAEEWIDDLVIVDHDNDAETSSMLRAFEADRRDVHVVKAESSLSIAAAANIGAREALGRWLLFLDQDAVLQRGSVARMVAAAGGARAPWIVGGRLLDLEGREKNAARKGALNSFSAIAVAVDWPAQPKLKVAENAGTHVGAVSGAFMLISDADFGKLNGFDEMFDTDYADLDLCRRAAAAGGSVLFQPDAACVQFALARRRRKEVQGLTLFAVKSARTPLEKAFAAVAGPALAVLLTLKTLIAGRPPTPRR